MSRLTSALGGLGLSTLFFLPVIAASHLQAPLLMWTHRDTGELVAAWLLFAAVCGAALHASARVRRPRLLAFLTLVILVPGLLSIVAVTGRAGVLSLHPVSLEQWLGLAALAGGPLLVAWLWWRHPQGLVRTVRSMLPFAALLVLPAVGPMRALPAAPTMAMMSVARGTAAPDCRSVVVVIFDELSYDAVFDGPRTLRPGIASRQAQGRVYRRASADGDTTDVSIAAYIRSAASRGGSPGLSGDGPFGVARRLGLQTEAFGWYYPYCESVGGLLDRCEAVSLYNASTQFGGVNPLVPLATTLTIWPYQWPTGIGKRPVATWLHRRAVDRLVTLGAAPITRPTLRWVHLNVPHAPWLAGTGPLAFAAFTKLRSHYDRQLAEVDRAFETIMQPVEATPAGSRPVVVFTADHGARQVPSGDPRHVPLVVLDPGGTPGEIDTPVRVADVIDGVVAGACLAPVRNKE